jgi:type VI secretion system protein VasG
MVKNEIESVLKLADTLNQRVIGQKHALDIIAKRIQTRAPASTTRTSRLAPMLCGTSGVGKTEIAPPSPRHSTVASRTSSRST